MGAIYAEYGNSTSKDWTLMKCRFIWIEKEIGNITSARISLCENWENALKLDSILRASHTWFIQCFTLRRGNIRLTVLNILGSFIPSTDFKPHPNANLIFFFITPRFRICEVTQKYFPPLFVGAKKRPSVSSSAAAAAGESETQSGQPQRQSVQIAPKRLW